MVETVRYARVTIPDLDLGDRVKELRLLDGRTITAPQIHPGRLFLRRTVTLQAVSGATALTATSLIRGGERGGGVTARVIQSFGTANGLVSLWIGTNFTRELWAFAIGLLAGTETNQTNFKPRFTTAIGGDGIFLNDTDVRVTADGGYVPGVTFTSVGLIELTWHYMRLDHTD